MTLFEKAISSIDEYNKKDPTIESENGVEFPKEYLNSQRQTKWLEKIAPDASEALKIAARSQHIGRWEIPRNTYPANRAGYLTWRSDLSRFHAEKTAQILSNIGYDMATIERVKELNLKKAIKLDAEAQLIEDMLCLVFLEYHIEQFAPTQDEEVLLNIIQKTWKKMGPTGKEEALKISYSDSTLCVLKKALSL